MGVIGLKKLGQNKCRHKKQSFFQTESPSERKYASSFLYEWKTSVTQIVSPQPTHPTKITLARIACLCFGLVTQRPLSNGGERALRDEAEQWLRMRLQCAWNQCSLGTINQCSLGTINQCVRLFQINWKLFFPLSLSINPFHPNISKYILHNFFYTFPLVLTRRNFWTIKSFIGW